MLEEERGGGGVRVFRGRRDASVGRMLAALHSGCLVLSSVFHAGNILRVLACILGK